MTNTTQRYLIAALAAVLALFVIACDAEQPKTPGGGGEQPKTPGGGGEQRNLILKAWASPRCSPYTIKVQSSGSGIIPPGDIHVASGGWDHTVTYASDKRIRFTLSVQAKDGCAEGWCKIEDGVHGSAEDSLNQYGRATCVYTTKGH